MPNSLFSSIRRRAAPPLTEAQRRVRANAALVRQQAYRLPAPLPVACIKALKGRSVAVVGGGFAGLMAARTLGQHGVKVTVFEARRRVGGRVLSSDTFSNGRITELGAELIGSIHTRWCALAIEYGLTLISCMDFDLYDGQRLNVKMTLDKALSMDEIRALNKEMEARVLRPIAKLASNIVNPERPWNEAWLKPYDGMSVADQLLKPVSGKGYGQGYGIDKKERLWKALELLLVNNNVARLEELNFLGLLCLVRGGQFDPVGDPLMGYWDELEIYRCADGCQTLAIKLAEDIEKRYGGKVHQRRAVTHIDLSKGAGIVSKIVRRDGKLEDRTPFTEKFDDVILAIPPTVWGDIAITPLHPKESTQVGLMNTGPAVKFFSDMKERFWIKDAAAPFGGSLALGQVWEGTDNQTRVGKQGVVLSVFTGARSLTEKQFKDELAVLYSKKYSGNLRDTLIANWPKQPFIKTGYASPALGQIFTVGKRLSEPFGNHMFFAGEHTQMDHFGYMEGALRSGERAAHLLMRRACGMPLPSDEPMLVADATRQREPDLA
jgi:monoamine oxidase